MQIKAHALSYAAIVPVLGTAAVPAVSRGGISGLAALREKYIIAEKLDTIKEIADTASNVKLKKRITKRDRSRRSIENISNLTKDKGEMNCSLQFIKDNKQDKTERENRNEKIQTN